MDQGNKVESDFQFFLRYLTKLNEYIDPKTGELKPDYSATGQIRQATDEKGNLLTNPDGSPKMVDANTGKGIKAHNYGSGQGAFRRRSVNNFALDYIWKNVSNMQKNNKPVAPAAPRSVMPQTDKAPGWDAALKAGEVNWKTECLVLSGLLIQD